MTTIRADFYDRPLLYRDFAALLGDGAEIVLPLSPDELERAIAAPARGVGLQLEDGLLAEIVAGVLDEPGALPLLQYALTELADRRDGATLTRGAYRAIGGISGALVGRAESLYGGLSEDGKEATRQLFLRLVNLGDAAETRRRVERGELDSLEVDQHELGLAIDAFGASRLLSFDRDPRTNAPTVEIAHEALLESWDRLREWTEIAREDVRLRRRLALAAAEWIEADRDPSFLLRGNQLARFESWAARSKLARTALEETYLRTSLEEREAGQAAEEQRRARERALERRSVLRLRALVGVLAVAALAAAGLTAFAFEQSSRSKHEARIAAARQLAAASIANLDVDPQLSILLAMRAVETTRGAHGTALPDAVDALHRAIAASRVVRTLPHGGTTAVAFSPDGTLLATAGPKQAFVWDTRTWHRLFALRDPRSRIHDVVFSPDGSRLATRSDDGTAIVWNARSGMRLVVLPDVVPGGEFGRVSFSPDGRALAADDASGGLRIWDLRRRRVVRRIRSAASLCGIAWNATGTEVAAGDCGSFHAPAAARIWDARTGSLVLTTRGQRGAILTLQFSPDGRELATPNLYGTADVWSAAGGRRLATLSGHTGEVETLAYSRDGERIATGGTDDTARVWDAGSGRQLLVLPGAAGAIDAVSFAPGGRMLAAAGSRGSVDIWDVTPAGSRDELTFFAHRGGVDSLAYTADGKRLSTTGLVDKRARLWDARTGELVQSTAAAFVPGILYGALTAGSRYRADVGATSPDGRLTVSVSSDGAATLYDSSGRVRASLTARHGGVQSVVFDSDGKRVATGNRDGTAVVWDAASGRPLRTFVAHQGIIEAVAFSPNGRVFATAGEDTTAKLWDLGTGKEVLTLTGHTFALSAVTFSPDGTRLATGSVDGTVRVYVLPVDELLAVARSRLTRGWTSDECKRYLGGSCPRTP